MSDWRPSTFEDQLLDKHFDTVRGTAYLELPISISNEPQRARRIDAVLIPGDETIVFQQGDYSIEEAREATAGQRVHVIEAKHALNRGVIGQVMVAKYLVEQHMNPADVVMSVIYAHGNADLRQFCELEGIQAIEYAIGEPEAKKTQEGERPFDVRRPADEPRRRAFLAGWTRAVNGQLFGSIRKRKTHANMGNLFGWIYGDQPVEFMLETWRRYVENSTAEDAGGG